jgi:hypothetical protein
VNILQFSPVKILSMTTIGIRVGTTLIRSLCYKTQLFKQASSAESLCRLEICAITKRETFAAASVEFESHKCVHFLPSVAALRCACAREKRLATRGKPFAEHLCNAGGGDFQVILRRALTSTCMRQALLISHRQTSNTTPLDDLT